MIVVVDDVQALLARAHPAPRRARAARRRRRRLPRRLRLAVLGLLRPGPAVPRAAAAARRQRHHRRPGPGDDDHRWAAAAPRRDRGTVGPLCRDQLHALHLVLGRQLQARKMLSEY